MFCKKCGQEISNDSKFWTYCGAQTTQPAQEFENEPFAVASQIDYTATEVSNQIFDAKSTKSVSIERIFIPP